MSEPKVHEVAPQIVGDEIPVTGSDQLKAVAKETRKEALARRWQRGLELARDTKEVDFDKFASKIASFGVDLEENPKHTDFGKVRKTPEENDLTVQVFNALEQAKIIFKHGIDDPRIDKNALIESVLEQARRIPMFTDRLEELQNATKDREFAEKLLKDPMFISELKKVLNGTLDKDFSNLVFDRFETYMIAKQDKELAEAEMEEWEARNIVNERELKAFEKLDTGDPVPTAQKAVELHNLRSGRAQRDLDIQDLQQNIDDEQNELNTLIEEKRIATTRVGMTPDMVNSQQQIYMAKMTNIQDEVDRIDNELRKLSTGITLSSDQKRMSDMLGAQRRTLTTELDQIKRYSDQLAQQAIQRDPTIIQKEIDQARIRLQEAKRKLREKEAEDERLKQLEDEERQLAANKKQLEDERRQIQKKVDLANNSFAKAQRELQEAKDIRVAEEKSFAENVKSSFGMAASELISGQLQDATESYSKGLEKAKAGWQSTQEQAFMTTLQNVWLGPERIRRIGGLPGFRKKETFRPMNKAQILRDYAILLKEGDASFTRSIMKRTLNPDADPPNSRTYNDEEIDDIFDKNPDLINKFKPEAVKQLLARKAMVGGFTPEDTYVLTSTEWGKRAIQQAFDQNTEFRAQITKVFGEGALQRHGFWQRFGHEMSKHPFWWTLLLGIPALFGTIGTKPERDTLENQQ